MVEGRTSSGGKQIHGASTNKEKEERRPARAMHANRRHGSSSAAKRACRTHSGAAKGLQTRRVCLWRHLGWLALACLRSSDLHYSNPHTRTETGRPGWGAGSRRRRAANGADTDMEDKTTLLVCDKEQVESWRVVSTVYS